MRVLIKSFDDVVFDAIEQQMEWKDFTWSSVGQDRRYALAGNQFITENSRSGQPITLAIETPWSWLREATVSALQSLCDAVGHTHTITIEYPATIERVYTVIFRRDQTPLDLTPIDPRREHFTGTIYLLRV